MTRRTRFGQGRSARSDELCKESVGQFMQKERDGDFYLTDAIHPHDPRRRLVQGYRHDVFQDEHGRISAIIASVTREKLFEVFMEWTDALGDEVDVVLETSHPPNPHGYRQALYRSDIDLCVLQSALYGHEDVLTNDGRAGIAIFNRHRAQEVQFDEHKFLAVYANEFEAYEAVLHKHRIACREQMKIIVETPHVHFSCERYAEKFAALAEQLGCQPLPFHPNS